MKHRVSLIALLLMLSSIPFHASAYDFSAVAPSGQILYYSINYDDMVAVVRPGTGSEYNNYVTGDLVIPDSVTYNGVTYAVTSLGVIIGRHGSFYGSFEDCNGLTTPNTYW